MQTTYSSRHFTLEKLGEGIYAAIASIRGGGFSNAGIIDLGDQTIVFDTFNTPQAGVDLREAAIALTGKPVTFAVNSHWHGDHIRGNQAFRDSEIISTVQTKKIMDEMHPERIQGQKDTIDGLRSHIESIIKGIEAEQDPGKKEAMLDQAVQYSEIEKTLLDLEYVSPTVTFETSFAIQGSRRKAELITFGGGHTQSDAVLYLPDDRVLFTADLLVKDTHPFMGDGNPDEWVAIMASLLELEFESAVPGHGPVGTKQDIRSLKGYIEELIEYAASPEAEPILPAKFETWSFRDFYAINFEFIKAYLSRNK